MSFRNKNAARIVGGLEAVPHSWPSSTFIRFKYRTNWYVGERLIREDREYVCGGFLVDRGTVVTAAHCIADEVSVEVDSKAVNIKVVPNIYFPTVGSMYKVYLGLHSTEGLADGPVKSPGAQVLVKQIIRVIIYSSIFYMCMHIYLYSL